MRAQHELDRLTRDLLFMALALASGLVRLELGELNLRFHALASHEQL